MNGCTCINTDVAGTLQLILLFMTRTFDTHISSLKPGLLALLMVVSIGVYAQQGSPNKEVFYEKGVSKKPSRVSIPHLHQYAEERTMEFDLIPEERKKELRQLSSYIRKTRAERRRVQLTFICTGNSRRSQLAQIWASTGAAYYGISGIETYSGGTVVTAFNRRIARTLVGAGFEVETKPGQNEDFKVSFSPEEAPIVCHSKAYNSPENPKSHFIAVLLCSDADAVCPVVPGAEYRVFIPYVDPKESDHTEEEREIYKERNAQIAREMLFVMSLVR